MLSLVAGSFAAQLKIKADSANLLPDDYISVSELNRIKERVGGIGPLMVIVNGEELSACVDFIHALADSLEGSPLINSVIRGRTAEMEFLSHNRLLYMDLDDLSDLHGRVADKIELETLKKNPFYMGFEEDEEDPLDVSDIEAKYEHYELSGYDRNYYLTEEGNGVILRLYPTGVITDVKFTKRLLALLDRTIESLDAQRYHPSLEVTYKGSFKNASTQYTIVLQDLKSTAMYAFLGVLVLISLYFRRLLSPLFIVFPLLMSLSWTFGVTYLVIGNLNQITVCLFAILFGLGIDFGIHIFARYREARRRGLDIEQALIETVCHTGSALTTTALTTAVAFFSLLFSDFKGFSEFGFIVGTGILFSLVAMVVVCPAFIVLAERFGLVRLQQASVPEHLIRRGRYPIPHLTLLLGILATAFSLYHVNDLSFEYDFKKLKPEVVQTGPQASLPDKLKETRSPAIVLTESRAEALAVVAEVKRIQAERGDSSTVLSVKSVYSFLPADQEQKLTLIADLRQMIDANLDLLDENDRTRVDSLRQYLDVRILELTDLPEDMTKSFSSKEGEILNFVQINASVPLRDGRNSINFAREVKVIETDLGTFYASSPHIIFAEMLELMLDDAVIAVIVTLLVVSIVLVIDLGSVLSAALVLTPLLTGLAWVTGLMYVLDFRINIYNMVAFPTVIGMGIDNAVHIFHRYREAGPGSLRLVLRTTGVALMATTLTTMVGFAGLVPAHHPALYWIGTVSLLGLGCAFITAVTLLPALLQLLEGRSD
ncbi:MAG: MMPL family transporter [Gemmatimonadetes bacterium]|nr:MMPL family transporter [Gemmatimonadota bacterium]MBT5059187.1 MMPL family transporter [Gemmatimonadota bacterium]MBT5144144.1 MMPL family transporter [Gemmatimonadota bacterium]MBT5586616.1 MMPL family transporter [Gemmatimonadota bacterium]MBT5964452.1 MMPL family transporter [Gemmatimonadota bacterium]